MIPKDVITKQHILDAIAEIDRNGVPAMRQAKGFDLVHNGKTYPPKYVLSLAAKHGTGRELDPAEFSGGDSIFLQVHPSVIHGDGVLFVPGMANTNGITFHTMDEARDLIDYEVLYTRTNWSDPQIQQRLQTAEKYEILVPRVIPLELIRNLPNG